MAQQTSSINLNKYLENTQSKSYFVAFVTVLFLILFILLGVIPAYGAVLTQFNQNKNRDEAIKQLTEKIAVFKTLEAESSSKDDAIEYLNNVFPTGNRQKALIENIFNKTEELDIFLSSISFTSASGKLPIAQAYANVDTRADYDSFSIVAEGSKDDLLSFIRELEDSRIIYNLGTANLNKKTEQEIAITGSNGDHILNLTADYFYMKSLQDSLNINTFITQ